MPAPTCCGPRALVEDGERAWQIQASDQLTQARDYQPLIIAHRNGAPVRLSDVANVYDGVEDRYNTGFFNTKPAVLLIVSRQPDANIIETVDAITAQLPALRAYLPAGVDMAIASDRSPSIRATLHEAERTLLIAVTLVILVVLLFLASFRAAFIPVAAVPVALVGSFGVMYLLGFSLNNLSLMALIVATGLVVDDAIVVLENISRHVELGKPPFEAAIVGAREVGWTLLSMNLALVAVFISILFMGGIVERLFREFSITLVAAILISLMVSLTLTPMLCSRWLGRQQERRAAQHLPADQRRLPSLARPRLRHDARLGAPPRAARRLPAARRDHAERVALHRRAEELPADAGHRAARRLHPRRRRPVVPGDAAEDRARSAAPCWPIRRSRAWPVSSAAAAASTTRRRSCASSRCASARSRPQEVVERINRSLPKVPGARMRLFVDQDIRFGGRGGGGGRRRRLRVHAAGRRHAAAARLGRAGQAPRSSSCRELTGFDDELAVEPAGDPGRRSRRGAAAGRRHGDRHAAR